MSARPSVWTWTNDLQFGFDLPAAMFRARLVSLFSLQIYMVAVGVALLAKRANA